jgi:hypothetical protein
MRVKIMSRSDIEKELENMIQKVLFNEKTLAIIKGAIDRVHKGQMTPPELRKLIVESRIDIIKKILELFPYYSNQIRIISEPDNLKANNIRQQNEALLNELHVKDQILEEAAQKMDLFIGVLKEQVE